MDVGFAETILWQQYRSTVRITYVDWHKAVLPLVKIELESWRPPKLSSDGPIENNLVVGWMTIWYFAEERGIHTSSQWTMDIGNLHHTGVMLLHWKDLELLMMPSLCPGNYIWSSRWCGSCRHYISESTILKPANIDSWILEESWSFYNTLYPLHNVT